MNLSGKSDYAKNYSQALAVYRAVAHGGAELIEERLNALPDFENAAQAIAFGLMATKSHELNDEFDIILLAALSHPQWLKFTDEEIIKEAIYEAMRGGSLDPKKRPVGFWETIETNGIARDYFPLRSRSIHYVI